MATLKPFAAIRPKASLAAQMIELPYDVMNRQEAAKRAQNRPYSFLHISRSEIDLPEDVDPYDTAVYEKARATIDEWIASGVLIQEASPALYLYQQEMDGRTQTGFVGCVPIDDYLENKIKKHELTRVEKEQDRIRHFDYCDANTEPVFLTYREQETLRLLSREWIDVQDPVYDLQTPDGVSHRLWVIDDANWVRRVQEAFSQVPALYIADGHHRSASAAKVGQKRRNALGSFTGDEPFNYFMAVLFPEQDLRSFDYNRVVRDLNGRSLDEFLQKLSAAFVVEPIKNGPYRPMKKHEFGLYAEKGWYRLTAKSSICSTDPVDGLDVSILQENVLRPLLGIMDPRTDVRIDFVGGIRGLKELEKRVHEDMAIAFALYPISVEELLDVADLGMIMPPKSTWFEPKLGSGLFLHKLSL